MFVPGEIENILSIDLMHTMIVQLYNSLMLKAQQSENLRT